MGKSLEAPPPKEARRTDPELPKKCGRCGKKRTVYLAPRFGCYECSNCGAHFPAASEAAVTAAAAAARR